MSEILVVLERDVVAPPDVTFDALADYTIMRPKILPEQFTGYQVTAPRVVQLISLARALTADNAAALAACVRIDA